ncbi:hypothetical protein L1049_013512 [Liquidambar formosana]|uniref:C2H2-type domain-containing protein n=1 Tax=Liquidambar formosana TaxID=63359 RepID=A0AAP0RPE0_LIQFO
MATTTTSKAGFFVYACKTCNRTFPSFQALGGHRASHKKPKAMVESKKMAVMATAADDFEEREFDKTNTTTLSLQIPNKALHGNKSNKVHECSICGSEFTSGQALGGHMRRHRTSTIGNQIGIMTMDASTTTTTTESRDTEKPRSILSLDLNLPAPEDDHHRFASNQQPLVFSAYGLGGLPLLRPKKKKKERERKDSYAIDVNY